MSAKKHDREIIELTRIFNTLARMGFTYIEGTFRIEVA